MAEHDAKKAHTKRDSETFIALGLFMVALAVTVLIGTYWTTTTDGKVVNALSGVVLLATALGFIIRGVYIKKRL